MCQKLTGSEPGLSSYFRLDQIDGSIANNTTANQDGQLVGFQSSGWQRSAAPIGTKSTYTYQPANHLGLALASGDSLLLSNVDIPEFVQLYFTEEVPNVLQAPDGHVLVDNDRYFGLLYPNPANDLLFIKDPDVDRVVIWNAQGKKCLGQEGQRSILDISTLPSGLYFVEIGLKSTIDQLQKITIQH